MRALFAVGNSRLDEVAPVHHAVGIGYGARLAAEVARRDGAVLTLITAFGPDCVEYTTFAPGDRDVERAVGESSVLPPVLPEISLKLLGDCDELVVVEPAPPPKGRRSRRRGDCKERAMAQSAALTAPQAKVRRVYGTREGLSWKSGRT